MRPKSNIWSVERTWYRDAPEESHEGFEEAGFQRKQSHYQQMQDVSCIYFITVTTPWILSFQIRHQDPWNSIYISSFQNLLETNKIIPILNPCLIYQKDIYLGFSFVWVTTYSDYWSWWEYWNMKDEEI